MVAAEKLIALLTAAARVTSYGDAVRASVFVKATSGVALVFH